MASRAHTMPPPPRIGRSMACATWYTMRRAMGFMAGPDSPPNTLPSAGRRASMSIAIPSRVFIMDMASAPASSAAFAMATMSVTLGESFGMTGSEVACLTARTTLPTDAGSAPKCMPPRATLGQDTFSSMPATPGAASSTAAICAYSSIVSPAMLAITIAPRSRNRGRRSRTNTSIPGFSRPMELSIPQGVSAMRGGLLPARGRSVVPFTHTAPTISGSMRPS